jgi:hypothetical protein
MRVVHQTKCVHGKMRSWALGPQLDQWDLCSVSKFGKRDRVILSLPWSCDVTLDACCGHLGGSYTSYNRG